MERNRTIIVRLSAQTPDGAIAEANLEYKRRSPKYESVLRYLGGMTPGEARPVYEWDFGLGTNA